MVASDASHFPQERGPQGLQCLDATTVAAGISTGGPVGAIGSVDTGFLSRLGAARCESPTTMMVGESAARTCGSRCESVHPAAVGITRHQPELQVRPTGGGKVKLALIGR